MKTQYLLNENRADKKDHKKEPLTTLLCRSKPQKDGIPLDRNADSSHLMSKKYLELYPHCYYNKKCWFNIFS